MLPPRRAMPAVAEIESSYQMASYNAMAGSAVLRNQRNLHNPPPTLLSGRKKTQIIERHFVPLTESVLSQSMTEFVDCIISEIVQVWRKSSNVNANFSATAAGASDVSAALSRLQREFGLRPTPGTSVSSKDLTNCLRQVLSPPSAYNINKAVVAVVPPQNASVRRGVATWADSACQTAGGSNLTCKQRVDELVQLRSLNALQLQSIDSKRVIDDFHTIANLFKQFVSEAKSPMLIDNNQNDSGNVENSASENNFSFGNKSGNSKRRRWQEAVENISHKLANYRSAVDTTAVPLSAFKQQKRCRMWPNCTKGDLCGDVHPTKNCRLFPFCKFGAECLFIHPACTMTDCRNSQCPYFHSS